MKKCNTCHIEKDYAEFNKRKVAPDGLSYYCKACEKIKKQQNKEGIREYAKKHYIENKKIYNDRSNKWYDENTDRHLELNKKHKEKYRTPYWIVYQLPNAANYVGYTNRPHSRMLEHKTDGRDTTGWIELHRFDTEIEALAKEAEYHEMGYPGKHINSRKSGYNIEYGKE